MKTHGKVVEHGLKDFNATVAPSKGRKKKLQKIKGIGKRGKRPKKNEAEKLRLKCVEATGSLSQNKNGRERIRVLLK